MSQNVIYFGWQGSVPGRENISGQHFDEFVAYLTKQQQAGIVDSWDVVFLDPTGSDANGFFLIKGNGDKLIPWYHGEEWANHMMRAGMHLQGVTSTMGVTGDELTKRMAKWKESIPK